MFIRKRYVLTLIVILLCVCTLKLYMNRQAPYIHSSSAILLDITSDEILFEKNANTAYPIASMSKLMTISIVLDLIKDGTIHWDDQVTISETANNIVDSAAKIPIEPKSVLTVRDLFYAMVISSANNATIALAEFISGSEVEFTHLMNETAKGLGLSTANFINATGLPLSERENEMSAKDVSLLASYIINNHSDLLEVTSLEHYYIDAYEIDVFSTNKMLDQSHEKIYLKEVDGLKTGYTRNAGFCFVSTAEIDGKRLVSVIINSQTDDERFIETKSLLEFGFGKFRPTLKQFIQSNDRKLILNE